MVGALDQNPLMSVFFQFWFSSPPPHSLHLTHVTHDGVSRTLGGEGRGGEGRGRRRRCLKTPFLPSDPPFIPALIGAWTV